MSSLFMELLFPNQLNKIYAAHYNRGYIRMSQNCRKKLQ